jgi:hypothetical protein
MIQHIPQNIIDDLRLKQQQGMHWVAYEPDDQPAADLRSYCAFDSALDASAYCRDHWWIREPEDGSYREGHYVYHSMHNLLGEIAYINGESPVLLHDVNQVAALMKNAPYDTSLIFNYDEYLLGLAIGRMQDCKLTREMKPADLIMLLAGSFMNWGIALPPSEARKMWKAVCNYCGRRLKKCR